MNKYDQPKFNAIIDVVYEDDMKERLSELTINIDGIDIGFGTDSQGYFGMYAFTDMGGKRLKHFYVTDEDCNSPSPINTISLGNYMVGVLTLMIYGKTMDIKKKVNSFIKANYHKPSDFEKIDTLYLDDGEALLFNYYECVDGSHEVTVV